MMPPTNPVICSSEDIGYHVPENRAFFELPSERTVRLDAADRDMCRFDHSKGDQERLELVCSFVQELYNNALTKAGPDFAPHQKKLNPQTTHSNRVAVQDLPSESADPKKSA